MNRGSQPNTTTVGPVGGWSGMPNPPPDSLGAGSSDGAIPPLVDIAVSASRPKAPLRPVDSAIQRTFLIVAGVAAVALVILGLVTGERMTLARATGPVVVAVHAAWSLRRRGSSVSLFLVSLVVLTVQVAVQQTIGAFNNGSYALFGLALAASLFAADRRKVLLVATACLVVMTVTRARSTDEPLTDVLLASLVVLAVMVLGFQLIEWAKREIHGGERKFENLFDNVPVAIWEEDFSDVARWLDRLRRRGVEDIRSYLNANPEEIRFGASLIEITNVNDQVLELLEAEDRSSLLGRLDPELILEETFDAMVHEFAAVWEGRPSLRIDLTGTTLHGNPIDGFLMMSAPMTWSGVDWSKVVVAMVDVSEQRATQRRLQELIESKDQFVASVSHELRTPLAAVIGFAEELRDHPDRFGAAEKDEFVALIADQAIDVSYIVEDLLVAARAHIGKVSIHPEPIGLESEFLRVCTLAGSAARPVTVSPDATVVLADPRRLRQILRNLVTNADRYGGEEVSISASRRGEYVMLEVLDNGPGIPDLLRERVFEPYETAHDSVGITGSVGLGLTVSRQLARLMGGDLTYDRVDGWTVFRLTLPAG
jgi:signal transduction histidine kinase